MIRVGLLITLTFTGVGCKSLHSGPRRHGPAASALREMWRQQILEHGQDGDWLVIRGNNPIDHLLAVTGRLTHVGILDATNSQVIEAAPPAVSELTLCAFLECADRIILIRPAEADFESGQAAIAKARNQVGAPYDLLGAIGLPAAGKFYCTELATWSAGLKVDLKRPGAVLHPDKMARFGEVIFDSQRHETNASR